MHQNIQTKDRNHIVGLAAALALVLVTIAACGAPAAPSPTPTNPAPSPTSPPATATPEESKELSEADILALIPDSAAILSQLSADLDGDGTLEYVVLAGFGGAMGGSDYDWLQIFVIEPDRDNYIVAWRSDQLIGQRGEKLQAQDINDDGLPEVLSVQSMGAAGQTLYVVAFIGQEFGFLTPHGGYFDGQESFGDNAVRLENVDGDPALEILAGYGPMASSTDVYDWVESETGGNGYVYKETQYEGIQPGHD